MVFRHLWYFLTVAGAGSFALAAKRLRLAQPALSRQIRSLEVEIGGELFERQSRGVKLTAPGTALLTAVRPIGDAMQAMLEHTRLAHEGKWGHLRIGLARAAIENAVVGRGIAMLGERYPGVEVAVSDMAAFAQVEMLRKGTLDLAIALQSENEEEDIRRELLFSNAIDHALVPVNHPAAKASSVSVADLIGLPLVTLSGSRAHGFASSYDKLRQLAPLEELESVDSVFSTVAAGRGWTVGPAFFAVNPPMGTAAVPLSGVDLRLDVAMHWRAKDDSALLANVVRVFRSVASGSAAAEPRRSVGRLRVSNDGGSELPHEIQRAWLRSFVATADAGSFSAAAERVGVTQSAISRQMQELEDRVGCQLLERDTHGVTLTRAGEVFAAEARAVLAMASDAIAQARDVAGGSTGRCVVGTLPPEFVGNVVSAGIELLSRRHPGMTVDMVELRSPAQLDALARREIDVAIAGVFSAADVASFESAQLRQDVFDCALLSPSHPLASRPVLYADDLANEPFLYASREAGSRHFDAIIHALKDAGIDPRIGPTFEGPRAMWTIASEGGGWLIGLRSQRMTPPAGLVGVQIAGLRLPWEVRLVWRAGDEPQSVRSVVSAFREAARK